MADNIDWCDLARKLRATKMAMLTGGMVKKSSLSDGSSVEWAVGSSLEEVSTALAEAERMCAAQCGETTTPKRARYAISGRARPY
jgi:hypothetical protein